MARKGKTFTRYIAYKTKQNQAPLNELDVIDLLIDVSKDAAQLYLMYWSILKTHVNTEEFSDENICKKMMISPKALPKLRNSLEKHGYLSVKREKAAMGDTHVYVAIGSEAVKVNKQHEMVEEKIAQSK